MSHNAKRRALAMHGDPVVDQPGGSIEIENSQSEAVRQAMLIASVAKNSREVLRIEMAHWCGHHFLNVRYWYLNEAGAFCPGKQGVSLRYVDLPKIIDALQTASKIATARGLA